MDKVLQVTVVKLWSNFSSNIRFLLDVAEDKGGGSGDLYSGAGVLPMVADKVASLALVGLSPVVTDEATDADTDADGEGGARFISEAEVFREVEADVEDVTAGVCVSLILGCSKSQETPCLEQLPHRG